MAQHQNLELAREGENWVADLLLGRGWTIIARNWRRPGTELDLVAWRQKDLLFIEVKTRRYLPKDMSELASWRKQRAMNRGIQLFIQAQPDLEFDTARALLAVVWLKNNAFSASWYPLDGPSLGD